ncbi:MAG: 50S ribosomal protein L6 [Alphaproteobacteria bacterium]|nr:50S ribosomal protein L6 [Alphaproteobacteria bacterium]
MSRIGRKPVAVPKGVSVGLADRVLTARGPRGELSLRLIEEIGVEVSDGRVVLTPHENSDRVRALWGLQRTLINNMVNGVLQGFTVDLEIVGVGYRAAVAGHTLNLQLGYSHPVEFPIPEGITIACERPTAIRVSGIDRQQVGEVAARIRRYRSPEPYKGKGVRYVGEFVERKVGKKK